MTATTKPVDVLHTLEALEFGFNYRRCPICAGFNALGNGESDFNHTDTCPAPKAKAAIAELIAADVEYDAAHSAYSKAPSGKSRNDAWDRVLYAERRRAAAIAAIQGDNVGGGS